MRTFILLCDGEQCTSYLIPKKHLHPQPHGTPKADTLLSDSIHACDEARASGWRTGIQVATDRWIDLCPPCAEVWEAERRRRSNAQEAVR